MNLSGLTFESPYFLVALVPIAGAAGLIAWRRRTGRDPGLRFPSSHLVGGLPQTAWARLHFLPDLLRGVALVLFCVALARPQMIGAAQDDDTDGIDIVLALDTSCSMKAADFQPNDRMFVAKKSIAEFVKQRTNDRIGLVVFAGEAATWAPLTLDYSLVAQLLDEVDTGMLPDGTAIGSAIATSINRLRDSDAKSRVVVLLTDGDSNAGNITPNKAAEMAKALGIRVYTILIGKDGPVPFPAGRDLFGRTVYREQIVPTNAALLTEIAKTTGGDSYKATDKSELDRGLSSVLDSLEKTRLDASHGVAPKDELFPQLVLAGIAVLALELLLGSTRLWRFP